MEVWKDVVGYEGIYQVSDLGRVKSFTKKYNGKFLKENTEFKGYKTVTFYKNLKRKTFKIHRLVAIAFIDNYEELPQVNHKDENKGNNTLENLEWCDNQYNIDYSKLKPVRGIDATTNEEKIFKSAKYAENYGFKANDICSCCKGRQKTHKGFYWEYSDKRQGRR